MSPGSVCNPGLEVLSADCAVAVGTWKIQISREKQTKEAWLVKFQSKVMTLSGPFVIFWIKN